jgi:hypothetical protein
VKVRRILDNRRKGLSKGSMGQLPLISFLGMKVENENKIPSLEDNNLKGKKLNATVNFKKLIDQHQASGIHHHVFLRKNSPCQVK